jgi:DNA ligase-1
LIVIPYWWDRSIDSLSATIYSHRSDLFTSVPTATPIPATKPTEKHPSNSKFFMTATEWDNDLDPNGWWMTEKYDGMRLYWTGSEFVTRRGNVLTAPKSVTEQLPKIALDGEIW